MGNTLEARASEIERSETVTAELDNGSDGEIIRLAKLNPVDYDRRRTAVAKTLGIRAATLDQQVARARNDLNSADDAGSAGLTLADPAPWHEPVNGEKVLDELAAVATRHLVLPTGGEIAIALWVMHAHSHDSATISPILGITSPTPECGKTTLLSLLSALVPRPLPASNITTSVLFRAVEKWGPTLLIDEADTYLRDSDELRGVINSGHMRASAWILRNTVVGDDYEPKQYRTWAPKAVALIGRLPATLESRAVHVELRRMAPGENVEQIRLDRLDFEPLRKKAWRWARDNADALRAADPNMGGLRGRLADNWRHLFAIADICGGEWSARARRAAEALSAGRSESTAGIMLLEDLRGLFMSRHTEQLSSTEIADALGKLEDRPWPEWGRAQKPITARQIARLLDPFGVRPTKFRAEGYTAGTRGYELAGLLDAFNRYLPSFPSATPPQASSDAGFGDSPSATCLDDVADSCSAKAAPNKGCGAVADETPQRRQIEL